MEGKGPGWWNGHCFRPILGYTCYLFLGTLCKNMCVLSCIYITYLDPVPLVATDPSPGSVPANGCRLLQHQVVGVFFLVSIMYVTFVSFLSFFFFSSQVSRVLCWGLMEMFGRWF